MMISWNGLSSFVLRGKPTQGEVTLVTDPYQNEVGLRFPRTIAAAIVVQSSNTPEANNTEAIQSENNKKPFLVSHAGEYEVQGIFVTGVRAPKADGSEHTIYRIRLEDMNIGFLGSLDRDLTTKELEELGDIDVLILPVGGNKVVLNKDAAADMVSQVEPRLVIPSYFEVPGLKIKLDKVEGFCKALSCPMEEINKLKLSRKDLPEDEIQIKIMSRG